MTDRVAQEKALQALHSENERLGLYKDAYAEQEPVALKETTQKAVVLLKTVVAGLESAIAKTPAQPAQRTEQEPVAWNRGVPPVHPQQKEGETFIVSYEDTHPPQRTWVGLTNQERSECWDTIPEQAMKKVEAKLKDKNQ
jgi:hypothetical protein